VALGWVPCRALVFAGALARPRSLFGLGSGRNVWWPAVLAWGLALTTAGHVIGVAIARGRNPVAVADAELIVDEISGRYLVFRMRTVAGAFVVAAIVMAIYFFGAIEQSPFIYFQF